MPRYESPYDPSTSPQNLEHVVYEKKGHIAYVTINRPDVKNALHSYAYARIAVVLAGHWSRSQHLCGYFDRRGIGILRRARREVSRRVSKEGPTDTP